MAARKAPKKPVKKPAKRASKASKGGGGGIPRPSLRTLAILGIGIGALVGLGGAGYGLMAVDSMGRSTLSDQPQRVEILWPMVPGQNGPRHLFDQLVRDEIQYQVETILLRSPDAFAITPLGDAGRWLQASGWFDGQPVVRRIDASTVRVEGQWRRPVAVVRYGRGELQRDYLIDSGHRLLPKVYKVGERATTYITGATYAPPGNPPSLLDYDTPWPDESVVAGLKLLLLMKTQPYAAQVAGVDVSDFFLSQKLEIITDRNTRVVWGGPVGEFIPGEADTQRKLSHLERLYNRAEYNRRIDAGLQRLEIFAENVIIDRTAGQR
jgi:hypothetical protein